MILMVDLNENLRKLLAKLSCENVVVVVLLIIYLSGLRFTY